MLIGFRKDAANAHALSREWCLCREAARIVANLRESADYVFRDGIHQRAGLTGGRFFRGGV